MMRARGNRRQIDAIFCDVGDVLILWDKDIPRQIEKDHGLHEGSVLFETLKSGAGKMATTGQITEEEWLRQVTRRLPREAVREWLSYHGELNSELVGLLTLAREAGVHVYLLTNATSRLWEDLAYHGIQNFADQVYCSYTLGLAKPDPEIYRHAVESVSVPPGRILYIEDTASWAEAGRRIGLVSHTYSGIAALKSDFDRLGLAPC
jgi:putative hydrolase of the HAD superfamily